MLLRTMSDTLINQFVYYFDLFGTAVFAFSGVLVAGRMFAPAIGIAEDPVTGNANGPLGAYLAAHRLVPLPERTLTFVAKQGEAIGRTGYVGVAVALDQHGAAFGIGGRFRQGLVLLVVGPYLAASFGPG